MKKYNKIIGIVSIGLMVSLTSVSATANWGHYHDHYHHGGGNGLAAGLLVGGLVGVFTGAAITSSGPTYIYKDAPPAHCYQARKPAWRYHFCDGDGCYVRTKWQWQTVCS